VSRILLVEDNAGDAQLMRIALAEALPAARLSVAGDGEQALVALHEAGRFDLVLLDLNLPRMSGHEVLAAVREDPDPSLRRQPVVVLTSSEASTDVERSYDLGAASHIRKPLELDDLFSTVEALTRYWFDTVTLP
jgi:two-component system, chemotaxis family, response regulator Rcp1